MSVNMRRGRNEQGDLEVHRTDAAWPSLRWVSAGAFSKSSPTASEEPWRGSFVARGSPQVRTRGEWDWPSEKGQRRGVRRLLLSAHGAQRDGRWENGAREIAELPGERSAVV
jgi:hypothetical protein